MSNRKAAATMSDRFIRLLAANGWERRETPCPYYYPDSITIDYIKLFPVTVNGNITEIPVKVAFFQHDENGVPKQAIYGFVLNEAIRPNNANRRTIVKGSNKVVTMLEIAGHLTAYKYVIYALAANIYKQEAKIILHNHNALPI